MSDDHIFIEQSDSVNEQSGGVVLSEEGVYDYLYNVKDDKQQSVFGVLSRGIWLFFDVA